MFRASACLIMAALLAVPYCHGDFWYMDTQRNVNEKGYPMRASVRSANKMLALGLALTLALATSAFPQAPVIVSFQGNGQLMCVGLMPGSTCSVEWASSLSGPWTNTWAALAQVAVSSDGTVVVNVPMFYRVRGLPSPPSGMVLVPGGVNSGTNPLTTGEVHGATYPALYDLRVTSFWMDRTEISKSTWDEVAQWAWTNGYMDLPTATSRAADHPCQASWYDCVKWCNARSEKAGLAPAYYTNAAQTAVYRTGLLSLTDACVRRDVGYRLPTEEEWEYAARGGLVGSRFPWGLTVSHNQANYFSLWRDGRPVYAYDVSPTEGEHPEYYTPSPYVYDTSPTGSFVPNGYGLHDMAGNVAEWCWDQWSGDYRVCRGGGCQSYAIDLRCGQRGYFDMPHWLGFRTIRSAGELK